jgi:hypothetical protein
MTGLNITGAALTLMMLTMAGFPALAKAPEATNSMPQATGASSPGQHGSKLISSFVPEDFTVPTLVETRKFKVVPLGPALAKVDFKAYMSSVEHLQKTFTRSTDWPHEGISDADAMRDMETEQARFRNRESFAYAVLTPDGSRERGCVYVYPSTVEGYDAVVRMWVTKDEYDAGFDAELYKWVVTWMRKDWPFAKIAYPGRAIAWDSWDPLVADNKAK